MADNKQACLRTLKMLYDEKQIDRAALLSARGRILSADTDADREKLLQAIVRNRGKGSQHSRVIG